MNTLLQPKLVQTYEISLTISKFILNIFYPTAAIVLKDVSVVICCQANYLHSVLLARVIPFLLLLCDNKDIVPRKYEKKM